MAFFAIKDDNKLKEIITFLIKETNIPKIRQKLNLYSDEFEITFLDNQIYMKQEKDKKNVYVKNKNLKSFFKIISLNNKRLFQMEDSVLLDFGDCQIILNDFYGNFIMTNNHFIQNKIKEMFNVEVYNDVDDYKLLRPAKKEKIFDEVGNLNGTIKQYAIKVGLDIRSSSSSLKIRISNLSNK